MSSRLTELHKKVRSRRLSNRTIPQVVAQLADAEVADFVAYLADHVSVETIGQLLSHTEAQRLFTQAVAVSTQERILKDLENWLSKPGKFVWRWDVNAFLRKEVAGPVPAPKLSEVTAWAESHGVSDMLQHPASHASTLADRHTRWHLSQRTDGTIADLLGASKGYPAADEATKKAALQFLRWAERHKRLAERRKKVWDQRPKEPQLQLLSHRLKEALRVLGEEHVRPVIPAGELVALADVGGTSVLFQTTTHSKESVGVAFAGFEHMPLRLDMEHPAELRVVLEWTLDAIHEKSSPLRPALLEILSEPSWARLLDELEGTLNEVHEQAHGNDERIVFRVESLDDSQGINQVEVSAAVQKRGKNGKWSAGAVKAAQKLIEHPAARREDLVVLDLLAVAERTSADRAMVLTEAVAALRGHARVFDAHTKERLQIVRTPPIVGLEPTEGGHRISVRISDYELTDYQNESRILAFDSEGFIHVADITDKLKVFIAKMHARPAILPAAAQDRTLGILPRLQPDAGLTIPSELRGEEQEPSEDLVVRLTPEEDGLEIEVQARPLGEGPAWPPGEGPRVAFGQQDGRRVHAFRNLGGEKTRARALLDKLGLPLQPRQRIEGLDQALDVLAVLELEEGVSLEWPEGKRGWRVGTTGDLRVRVRRAGEWFGVDGEAEVDGQKVPLAALLQAVRRGQRYVRVSKGRFAHIEASLRERIEGASDALVTVDGEVQVGLGSIDVVDGLGVMEADDAWRDVVARARAAKDYKPDTPDALQASLRDYQQEGFQWLAQLASWGAGGCLADEMGLGKTVQTLALLLHRQNEGPSLVVAPTSVAPGWEREAASFTPDLKVRMYRGPKREKMLEDLGPGTLLITSYDVLARDGERLSEIEFGTVVLDEAQAIKNARTRRAKAARLLQAKWRLALTGTPLENHLGEVWSIYRTVSPGLLGPWEHFRRHYALPIERDGDAAVRDKLVSRLRPFLLRRTKSEVAAELPPRTEVVLPIELSEKERRLYDATRDEAMEKLGSPDRFAVLAALTRLRRLACHPRLVAPSWTGSSSKLDRLLELTDELVRDGRRALVFSQFTSHLAIVREALDFRSISSLYLDGKTPAKKRAKLVEEWQEGDAPIFLISLKAGGVGLNLTAADTVVHLDPWWNPAVEDQASDRAHRIGQEKPVTILRLVAQETIEEKVLLLHQSKRELADALLAGGDAAAKLNVDDLLALMD